jgi:SAM-dependent methyltransferase
MIKRIAQFVRGQQWKKGREKAFAAEFERFRRTPGATGRFTVNWEDRYPCLDDNTSTTDFNAHYIYHPAWAARKLAQEKPPLHVDISSTLHFPTIVSAFFPVKFYDFRPAPLHLTGMESEANDLCNLSFESQSIVSLSCMHVVEHVGLGRYGDPLQPDGDLKAASELKRVLAPGGLLLFVVPVGRPRICFNAHRVYAYEQVLSMFDGLNLEEYALLPDEVSGGLVTGASAEMTNQQSFGCGCFAFRKPA